MALLKQTNPNTIPSGAVVDQVIDQVTEPPVPETAHVESQPVYADTQAEVAHILAMAPAPQQNLSASPVGGLNLANLEQAGFEGLALDWTSFPSISLKNEGRFEDFDGFVYGTEFSCYIRGSKRRWVFRGAPVQDNKRDVAYSYDRVTTQNGTPIADTTAEWRRLGKTVEEKEYLEVLVEMLAPGTAYDGEYRIVSISPTSKGRFSGHIARAAAIGGGDPGAVVSKFLVGPKITKVQNPYYPFAFEIVK